MIQDNFSNEEFSTMLFNVMNIPSGKTITEVYPELAKYPEFGNYTGMEPETLLRYVFLMYDRHTPLKKVDDIISRKIQAAQIAGFEPNEKGYFDRLVDDMMRGFNADVNKMIIRALRLQHDITFSTMVTGNEALYQKQELILSAADEGEKKSPVEIEKIKGELWKQAKAMRDDLDKLALICLNNDNNPYLKKDLFCVIDRESQQLNLTPERVAQRQNAEA
jgi:hypothetical protein